MWINEGRTHTKKIGILLLILVAAIGLVGCSKEPKVYEHDGMEYTVDVNADTITNERHTYNYSISITGDTKTIEIIYPNNSKWTKTITDGWGSESYTDERAKLAYAPGEDLYSMIEQAEDEGFKISPKKIIFGIIGVGIFMIPVIAPYKCWKITHGWKFRDAEPSDAYIAGARVFGIVLAIAWVVLAILIKE